MRFRPVEVLILTFPGERVDPLAVEALRGVVEMGDVTLLDIVFAAREPNGDLRVVEFDDGAETFGFGEVEIAEGELINDEDIAVVADALAPGHAAVLIAYENTWVRRVSEAIRDARGQVALHVLIPTEAADDALRGSS
ncbi:DUF6325 family protein [Jiangella rhizosphaerae]|uniref:DUF1269 domain-containing protein n=1 Tax=Jiangella rhizosphaerae TaxID=2293569 RepID=A0A418KPQ3_9ACTN|nr:DUF6325 family protein [Jiangella rhizosphaerae]RIQ21817.1 DUF1269 domain-containing protein [Jiangella rhizosphaerae]